MCMQTDKEATKKAKLTRKPEVFVTRYKVIDKRDNKLVSAFFPSYIWETGLNKSNRPPLSKNTRLNKEVYKGIHVYVKLKDAKTVSEWDFYNSIAIAVQCKNEDLIAVGYQDEFTQEVYTQVTLSEKEYKRAMKIKK